MKAAVLYKANTPLEVVDVKQEDPRAGEARVKVKAAGVCHSDWHIMNGDWTVPLRREVGLPHFSDPEHKVEYDPQLLRDELAAAEWQMAEPRFVWGEIWVEASAAR